MNIKELRKEMKTMVSVIEPSWSKQCVNDYVNIYNKAKRTTKDLIFIHERFTHLYYQRNHLPGYKITLTDPLSTDQPFGRHILDNAFVVDSTTL